MTELKPPHTPTPPTGPLESDPKTRRMAVTSSFIGTTLEYYDFLLYSSAAALVFPALFFSGQPPFVASLLSFATLAVGYFARPIGGLLFGHFGDRYSRKTMLVITLVIMGLMSTLIGLLPTSNTIGVAAPIILVFLRVIQGIAVGGEWAGAALMSMEHAKGGKKGFAGSLVAAGGPGGAVLASAVLGLFSLLPDGQFMSWGWRVPFLLSAALVVVGIVLRTKVGDSPEFIAAQEQAAAADKEKKVPLLTVLKEHPGAAVIAMLGSLAPLFMQGLISAFILTFAVSHGHAQSQALFLVTIAHAIHAFTIPAFAALSDRIGRKPVMVGGAVLGIILVWPMFWAVQQGSPALLLIGFIIGNPIVQGSMYGPLAAWIAEKYPATVRYTGVSLSYQIGTTLGAGLAPLICAALLQAKGDGNPQYISLYFVALCIISGLAYLFSRDHSRE
ncbi:MFS transporter [Brevibacterium moorei]|uniref:MFS transporter n=1 Tax=Brevibacterium moorei TaxID=2968457 RepID=UPI00211C3FD5|nr:MFS transporter [Brevibacterium sp. 68QC2CO]MCQ9385768.1 MHS family MFS transporter [Brevibacterium sp. 68QC2CO]